MLWGKIWCWFLLGLKYSVQCWKLLLVIGQFWNCLTNFVVWLDIMSEHQFALVSFFLWRSCLQITFAYLDMLKILNQSNPCSVWLYIICTRLFKCPLTWNKHDVPWKSPHNALLCIISYYFMYMRCVWIESSVCANCIKYYHNSCATKFAICAVKIEIYLQGHMCW